MPLVTEERYWALFYMPLVTEERYRALFYMPLYTFLHNLLIVLVQIANQMGLQKYIRVRVQEVLFLLHWHLLPCEQASRVVTYQPLHFLAPLFQLSCVTDVHTEEDGLITLLLLLKI
jgi:hypothetical protein